VGKILKIIICFYDKIEKTYKTKFECKDFYTKKTKKNNIQNIGFNLIKQNYIDLRIN